MALEKRDAGTVRAWVVDTFADNRYAGNPAAVIISQQGFPPLRKMQSLAFHLGFPTTAFVVPDSARQYRLRWFTPKKELRICGHATIAAAAYLYARQGMHGSPELCFQTRSGPLYAQRKRGYISLNLPRMDVRPCTVPGGLEQALGTRVVYCAAAVDDVLVEVESEQIVARLQPNFEKLKKIPGRGQVVTARSNARHVDFVSRSFFPALGVNEDQVCVSAHCKLGPYWSSRLGKRRMCAVQLSVRGGQLLLEVTRERVHVAGMAAIREHAIVLRW